MPVLVFLGEVGRGAQHREREEAGACASCRHQRGLQPPRQWGQGQGQSLQLGQLVGLELLSADGVQLRSSALLVPLLLGNVGQDLGTYPIRPLEDFSLLVRLHVQAVGHFVVPHCRLKKKKNMHNVRVAS